MLANQHQIKFNPEKLKIRNMEKLNFIDTYWSQLNQIIQEMEDQLPILPTTKTKPRGKYLNTINYSQMNDWSVSGVNTKLKALADKIKHMILKGDAPNVKPKMTGSKRAIPRLF